MKQTGLKFRAEDLVKDFRRTEVYSYRAPWYEAVQWSALGEFIVTCTLAGCLLYLGIFVFGPFAIRMMR